LPGQNTAPGLLSKEVKKVEQIRQLNIALEPRQRAREFLTVARLLCAHRGHVGEALQSEEGARATERVKRVLRYASWNTRTAVTPGSTASGNWAAPLAEFQTLAEAFSATLQYSSVFDRMLADGGVTRIPLRTRIVTITTAASGSEVGQLQAKPVSQMALGSEEVEPVKVVAVHVVSEEIAKFATPSAVEFFNAGLRRAVATATDSAFLSGLLVGVTPTASAGTSHANFQTDLAALLVGVDVGSTSRVYLIMRPDRVKTYVPMLTAGNTYAFPSLTLAGGPIVGGIEVLVSDQVPTGRVILVVADGLLVGDDAISLDASREALLQMNTTPDSPATAATTVVSLWQQDLVGIRADRLIAFNAARSRSVAALSY
jgi:HK97 family phage major capsid protein